MAERSPFPFQQTERLLREYLRDNPHGEVHRCVQGVIDLAMSKDLFAGTKERTVRIGGGLPDYQGVDGQDQRALHNRVEELLWRMLVQGLLVFGQDRSSHQAGHKEYRLTEHGVQVLKDLKPQPYDPDGFLAHFRTRVPGAPEIVTDYLAEAVRAFNAHCPKSAMTMLGCASEALVLDAVDTYAASLGDEDRKAFEKKARRTVADRFSALTGVVDAAKRAKRLPRSLVDATEDMEPIFQLVRRQRNAAGHPKLLGEFTSDMVFERIVVFVEYAHRLVQLRDFLVQPPP